MNRTGGEDLLKRITGWILSTVGMLLFQGSLAFAGSQNPAAAFDLFGLAPSAVDQGLGKRAQALGEALTKAFPQSMKGKKFQENSYSGVCFVAGPDSYQLAWYDSETEGFLFSVTRLQDPKTCANPFTEGLVFPMLPLNPSEFFPISRTHPAIQLGVSTLTQVRKEMGKPGYAGSDILVYALKRDREKEKGCDLKPSAGELAVIGMQFRFKEGVLQSVYLVNTIAGEC